MLSSDTKITDYSKACQLKYACGFVSIGFRKHTNPSHDISFGNFVLNSCNDGWFRKDNNCGVASRYGLCIQKIEITGRTPQFCGDFVTYKVAINYIDSEENLQRDMFWLFIHRDFTIEDVLEYIETHKGEWTP